MIFVAIGVLSILRVAAVDEAKLTSAGGDRTAIPTAAQSLRRRAASRAGRRRRRNTGREAERRDVRGIHLVTVDGDVAHFHVRLAHSERNEEIHQLEQDERDYAGEEDHPKR